MTSLAAWVGLAAALAALMFAWKLSQELAVARSRLDRYNKALFEANDQVAQLREQLAQGLAEARVTALRAKGDAAFDVDMTVREAQLLHPQAQEVLAGFHLGGCESCAVGPEETLAQICARSGIEPMALAAALNQLLSGPAASNGDVRVRLPNVRLEV